MHTCTSGRLLSRAGLSVTIRQLPPILLKLTGSFIPASFNNIGVSCLMTMMMMMEIKPKHVGAN
jgi:hypothetical protein